MTQVSSPLYIVTRNDIPTGYQIAQTAHAVAEFAKNFNDEFLDWHNNSQYIIILSSENEETLKALYHKAISNNLDVISFKEPDIDYQVTSIAFSPDPRNKKFLSKLPLAGKDHSLISRELELA